MARKTRQEAKELAAFHEYADGENARATFGMMCHGLGVPSDAIDDPQEECRRRIQRAIAGLDVKHKKRSGLQHALESLLAPLLRRPISREMSVLDLKTLGLTEDHNITRFLESQFGINLDDPTDLKDALGMIQRAIEYFDNNLAGLSNCGKMAQTFKSIHTKAGILGIFKTAAGKRSMRMCVQACALLKLGKILYDIDHDPTKDLVDIAMARLKSIQERHFPGKRDNGQKRYVFDTRVPGCLPMPLVRVETHKKTEASQITKLIKKRELAPQDIRDRARMRVTTGTKVEALQLIYRMLFVPQEAVFPGAKIIIGDSKNLIFDDKFLSNLKESLTDGRKAAELFAELSDENEEDLVGENTDPDNPLSSDKFKSINIVLKISIKNKDGRNVDFPIEIQVLDLGSYMTNEAEAPHGVYADIGLQKAADRVTGDNLVTAFKASRSPGPDLGDEEERARMEHEIIEASKRKNK